MDYSLVTDMFWKWQWDELRNNINRINPEKDDTK
jgi:hypothetical protein